MKVLRRIAALRVGDESGSSAVEFSITLSLLLSVIFGIMVCAMALYADHFVTDAAKEATRYAMVRGSSWGSTSCATYASYSCVATSSNVTTFVDSLALPGISTSGISVATTWPGTDPTGETCDTAQGKNSPACVVNVQVQYSFNFLLPFVPFGTLNLSGVSSDVITQ
jgi:Flp pilus assembly protein TadG